MENQEQVYLNRMKTLTTLQRQVQAELGETPLREDLLTLLGRGKTLEWVGKHYADLIGRRKPISSDAIREWGKGFGFPTRSKSC